MTFIAGLNMAFLRGCEANTCSNTDPDGVVTPKNNVDPDSGRAGSARNMTLAASIVKLGFTVYPVFSARTYCHRCTNANSAS